MVAREVWEDLVRAARKYFIMYILRRRVRRNPAARIVVETTKSHEEEEGGWEGGQRRGVRRVRSGDEAERESLPTAAASAPSTPDAIASPIIL